MLWLEIHSSDDVALVQISQEGNGANRTQPTYIDRLSRTEGYDRKTCATCMCQLREKIEGDHHDNEPSY